MANGIHVPFFTVQRALDPAARQLEALPPLHYHLWMFAAWFSALQGSSSPLGSPLVLMAIIFGVFYFIVIRPARKAQQDTESMRDALKNGDRIMTNGGIYGTVVSVSDETIQLRIADSVKIQLARSAVAQRVEEPSKRT